MTLHVAKMVYAFSMILADVMKNMTATNVIKRVLLLYTLVKVQYGKSFIKPPSLISSPLY